MNAIKSALLASLIAFLLQKTKSTVEQECHPSNGYIDGAARGPGYKNRTGV
jgi:hypothetical protein